MFFVETSFVLNAEQATAFVWWKAVGLWGRLAAITADSQVKEDHGTLDFHSPADISAPFWDTSMRKLQENTWEDTEPVLSNG